jgi:hypothetical protein
MNVSLFERKILRFEKQKALIVIKVGQMINNTYILGIRLNLRKC